MQQHTKMSKVEIASAVCLSLCERWSFIADKFNKDNVRYCLKTTIAISDMILENKNFAEIYCHSDNPLQHYLVPKKTQPRASTTFGFGGCLY